jgi:hypothetical protein
LDAAYNADVVSWLSELRSQLATAGKWGAVNQATYLAYDRTAQDEASAIVGGCGHKIHLPVKITVEMLAMNWTGR